MFFSAIFKICYKLPPRVDKLKYTQDFHEVVVSFTSAINCACTAWLPERIGITKQNQVSRKVAQKYALGSKYCFTHWVMTATIHDATDTVYEAPIHKTTIHKLAKLSHIHPATDIILLHTFNPIKHSRNPLEFLKIIAAANNFRVFAKVYGGIGSVAVISGSASSTNVVIKLAEIAVLELMIYFRDIRRHHLCSMLLKNAYQGPVVCMTKSQSQYAGTGKVRVDARMRRR